MRRSATSSAAPNTTCSALELLYPRATSSSAWRVPYCGPPSPPVSNPRRLVPSSSPHLLLKRSAYCPRRLSPPRRRPSSMEHLDPHALVTRFDDRLKEHVDAYLGHDVPPQLHAAIRHAVFGSAGRLRPLLCLAVAHSYPDADGDLALSAATAVELIHCASLVHDDLPCFDDADTRRGRPTVHVQYGESLAVLTGDALIVMAFEALTGPSSTPHAISRLVPWLARATGPAGGIVAGQAWEAEPDVPLAGYHRAKTARLFEFAVMAGALAGGAAPGPWRRFGRAVGMAYQAADDIADHAGASDRLGKPVGQDDAHHRPNAVRREGIRKAMRGFEKALERAHRSIPHPARPELPAACLLILRKRVLEWFPHATDTTQPRPAKPPRLWSQSAGELTAHHAEREPPTRVES
ncbi:MAG: polyprenyl synthetase family protein [Myxococcales bacterium FL481]|nr:MAG: polyprenyl synthetase family protein [Myxococcales bacterium FL481]